MNTTSKMIVTNEVVEAYWCSEGPFQAVRVIWDGERTLAIVTSEGYVKVLDQVAKHYTFLHSMSKRQCAKVRRLLNED